MGQNGFHGTVASSLMALIPPIYVGRLLYFRWAAMDMDCVNLEVIEVQVSSKRLKALNETQGFQENIWSYVKSLNSTFSNQLGK